MSIHRHLRDVLQCQYCPVNNISFSLSSDAVPPTVWSSVAYPQQVSISTTASLDHSPMIGTGTQQSNNACHQHRFLLGCTYLFFTSKEAHPEELNWSKFTSWPCSDLVLLMRVTMVLFGSSNWHQRRQSRARSSAIYNEAELFKNFSCEQPSPMIELQEN